MSFVNDLSSPGHAQLCIEITSFATWTDSVMHLHNSVPYSTLASVTPVLGFQMLRGDGSILLPRRINQNWMKPSMAVANALSVIGLGMDIGNIHIGNETWEETDVGLLGKDFMSIGEVHRNKYPFGGALNVSLSDPCCSPLMAVRRDFSNALRTQSTRTAGTWGLMTPSCPWINQM